LFKVAVPVKFAGARDEPRPKDKLRTDPEIVMETVPESVSVDTSVHAGALRVWTPAALMIGPEKVVPDCVSDIENAPPSLNVQPFDPTPVHAHCPLQVPARLTLVDIGPNVAVTDTFEFIVTVQEPVPGQDPADAGVTDHPVNDEPAFCAAVNITMLPEPKLRQLAPQ